MTVKEIIEQESFNHDNLVTLLAAEGTDVDFLLAKAAEIKEKFVGNTVYFRGLIEYSNICAKNCFYCGVRNQNKEFNRYIMTDDEVIDAAKFAYDNKYASIVIQSGERIDNSFTQTITHLIKRIHSETNNSLRITLSLGEHTEEVYKGWFDAGANRYLLRVETSSKELYEKLHPQDGRHLFEERMKSLDVLMKLRFQTGTGVMIGLPFQTLHHLADDLLFFQKMDFHMFGMGPYIEHEKTPLYEYRHLLASKEERFLLSLKMVAILRILMKDVNIAATTAMQAIDPMGREKAIKAGANIIMPNLTPVKYREDYLLYEGKPCLDEDAAKCSGCLTMRIKSTGNTVGFGEYGDSRHFNNSLT